MVAEVRELIDLVRRNEEIQARLDMVDRFLLAHPGLEGLANHLCRQISHIYELESVTLALNQDNQRFWQALTEPQPLDLPPEVFWRARKEMRLILTDLERAFLCNKLAPPLLECFFPQGPFLASAAFLPLWVRGEFLGVLSLGSSSPKRYTSGLNTDFLNRLAFKLAIGLDSALLMQKTRLLEKREAAVEMAGTACHELAQPLTTMSFLVEKLTRILPDEAPGRGEVEALRVELEKAGGLIKRISQVCNYVTRPYAQGLRIVDLDAACADNGRDREER